MNRMEMTDCARSCADCAEVCLETIPVCLGMGGEHASPAHITLLQVCAGICHTSQTALLLATDVHMHTCQACAAICERCAADCEALGGDEMQVCINACHACAESCRKMLGGGLEEVAA